MDPINILIAINLFLTISANFSGAKKGLKTSITKVTERPRTMLQQVPPNVSAIILLLTILAVFGIGTLSIKLGAEFQTIRIIGLGFFIVFSWIQVWSYKILGKNYSQDIVIMKEHELCTRGLYKFIRHPQYLSQLLSDIGAGVALLSYIVVPATLLIELPLFVARAVVEDRMLKKHFGEKFAEYKKRSGFMIPFIG
jgi:protein-S-isoprenylcysteine O-methyltransferase Ste14